MPETTAPAYAKLVAVRPYLWGGRHLEAGETVIAIRARSAADLKTFADNLRWSAFKIESVDPPKAIQPVADPTDLAELIAAQTVDQLADLPGLGAKSATKLRDWATSTVAARAAAKAQAEAEEATKAAAAKAAAEAEAEKAKNADQDAQTPAGEQAEKPPAV